jgi:E3 ubiquitin-protein ligase RFWD2
MQTWDSRSPEANGSINVKANVCSVKYNPCSMWEIAVGSADHFVHVYDIRSTGSGPLHVFTGDRLPHVIGCL